MLELITDRTAADVKRWQQLQSKGYANMTEAEKTEWNSGMKGAYNVTDLNRVGNALKYIKKRLSDAGYIAGYDVTDKTDWKASDIPTTAEFDMYINSFRVIRNALTQRRGTPNAPTRSDGIDYQTANDIERILIESEYLLNQLQAMYHYYGDLYCGEI